MRAVATLMVSFLLVSSAQAQQTIEWRFVAAPSKGANLPVGTRAAVVGIGLGDSFSEVRKLADELAQEDRSYDYHLKNKSVIGDLIRETKVRFNIPIPGGGSINAEYSGILEIYRNLKGAGSEAIYDKIKVFFSAPSSGNQVVGVHRYVIYHNVKDQPKISSVVEALTVAMRTDGVVIRQPGNRVQISYIYDNGALVSARDARQSACREYSGALRLINQSDIASLNPSGKCDVALVATFEGGITPDHASRMTFELSDNDRAMRNAMTDYSFFSQYVGDLAKASRPVPKL